MQWLGSTPGKARVAPASTLQRTAYLEAKAVAGQPTRFEIRYAVTILARHTAIDPAKVQLTPTDPALKPYLAEQLPHVRFTPALKLFSDQVLQGETRPYEVLRKLFAGVDRIPGPVRANTPRSATSAITRCMPAMPTAANRPCC